MRAFHFVVISILLFSPFASACDCGQPGPACVYTLGTSVIFTGSVVFTDEDSSLGLAQRTFVKFQVEEAFKGLSPDTREVWVDPGSFTSCYATYQVGERYLVFAYGGSGIPTDTAAMSIIPGRGKPKPLPNGLALNSQTLIYSAPECSGTRSIVPVGNRHYKALQDAFQYLRSYRAGHIETLIRGRVFADRDLGGSDTLNLRNAEVTLLGEGSKRVAKTDADGEYRFPDVHPGRYAISPLLPPYVAVVSPRSVELRGPGCGVANFRMVIPGIIEGTLLTPSGKPAHDVLVELAGYGISRGRDDRRVARTDAHGRYQFDQVPRGIFEVGVNIRTAPTAEYPHRPTRWTRNGEAAIHLGAGEKRRLTPFRLPARVPIRKISVEVYWPDNRPAERVITWAEIEGNEVAIADTSAQGRATLNLLAGMKCSVGAKIWLRMGDDPEVAYSGSVEVKPGTDAVHLKLILNKRSSKWKPE